MTQAWATKLKVQLLFREEMEAEEEPSMIKSREVMIKLFNFLVKILFSSNDLSYMLKLHRM